MDQSRMRAKENVEYVETLGVHWRNLSAFQGRPSVSACSGDVEAGQAVALMGPTGCGKTSLLNALAREVRSAAARSGGDDLAWSSR